MSVAHLVSKPEQHPVVSNKVNPLDAVAKDQPSQMAANEITRNLFFGDRILWSCECSLPQQSKLGRQDRGNNRVRVIFGSLGPQPQTQDGATQKFDFWEFGESRES